MTAKFKASADGTKVTIGTAAEDALEIDAAANVINALAPYIFQQEGVAVLEFVTVGNQRAIKFANGALVCFGFSSMSVTWTSGATISFGSFGGMSSFAVPFVGTAPTVIPWCNNTDVSGQSSFVSSAAVGLAGITGGYVSSSGTISGSSTNVISYVALGRWKA